MPRGMWDLSSPTRDQTRAPCIVSTESYPLDCQGSLYNFYYRIKQESQKYNTLYNFTIFVLPSNPYLNVYIIYINFVKLKGIETL